MLAKYVEAPLLKQAVSFIYNPKIGVGYIFIANLIASIATIVLLIPEYFHISYKFDKQLWKELFKYAWPLMILGLAGSVNETFDRVIRKWIIPNLPIPNSNSVFMVYVTNYPY